MNESNKIRFIATNYVNLQGLRNVPFGISIILLALLTNGLLKSGLTRAPLWANGLAGAAKYYAIGGVILVSMIVSLLLIDKYYFHYFGRVKRTPESSRFEWLDSNSWEYFIAGCTLCRHNLPVASELYRIGICSCAHCGVPSINMVGRRTLSYLLSTWCNYYRIREHFAPLRYNKVGGSRLV